MVWPEPAQVQYLDNVATIPSRDAIYFQSNAVNCSILNAAFGRYSPELLFRDVPIEPAIGYPTFDGVEIILPEDIANFCNEYPKLAGENERETYEKCKFVPVYEWGKINFYYQH